MTNPCKPDHPSKGHAASTELGSEQVPMQSLLTLLHTVRSPCRLLQFSCSSVVLLLALLASLLAHLGSATASTAGPDRFTLLGRGGKQPCHGASPALPRLHWAPPCLATAPSAPHPEAHHHLPSAAAPQKHHRQGGRRKKGQGAEDGSADVMPIPFSQREPEKKSDVQWGTWIFLLTLLPQ